MTSCAMFVLLTLPWEGKREGDQEEEGEYFANYSLVSRRKCSHYTPIKAKSQQSVSACFTFSVSVSKM